MPQRMDDQGRGISGVPINAVFPRALSLAGAAYWCNYQASFYRL
jgi:hypothetical protein